MDAWTGRPPKTRCPARRSRRPTRACCWAARPRPARGATATRSATATSPRSAPFRTEGGRELPGYRLAYETWGELNAARDNAVLVLHALTGDSHVRGAAGPGHPTAGWWDDIVGPGAAIDTDRWFVIAPNMLGGCQGSTGPASIAPDGYEWAVALPVPDHPRPGRRAGAPGRRPRHRRVGGRHRRLDGRDARPGVGGRACPSASQRVGILSAPPVNTADQIALNSVQLEAIQHRPALPGRRVLRRRRRRRAAPRSRARAAHGAAELPLARPSSTSASSGHGSPVSARSATADASRSSRTSTSTATSSPAASMRTATSRLVEAMNSHDVGRDRGGVEEALARGHRDDARARHRQRPALPGRRAAPHRARHPHDARRRARSC